MTNSPPDNDPRSVWQNQNVQDRRISVEDIRRRAHRVLRRAWSEAIFVSLIGVFTLVPLGLAIARTDELLRVAALGLPAAGLLYAVYLQLQLMRRMFASRQSTGDAQTSIAFYRCALRAKRDFHRRAQWVAIPVFLGVGLIALPRRILVFSVVAATWGVLFFYLKRRGQDWLRRELESLDAFERETRS